MPPSPRELLDAVETYASRDDHVSVVQLVERWSLEADLPAEARLLQGRAFHALRLMDRAMARAQEVVDGRPDDVAALALLADTYVARGWPARARRPLARLRDLGAPLPELEARAEDEPPRADPNARAIEASGEVPAMIALAETCLATGSFLRATGILERVKRVAPDHPRATALLWAITGDFTAGVELDAWVRRARAPDLEPAGGDEPEHTETGRAAGGRRRAGGFPTLFKGTDAPAPEDTAPETTQSTAMADRADLASDGDPEDTGSFRAGELDRGSGDTQILIVVRPGEEPPAALHKPLARSPQPFDLRAWQRDVGGAPAADPTTDEGMLEEEDANIVLVRQESRPVADEQASDVPIQVIHKFPAPPPAPAAPPPAPPPAPLPVAVAPVDDDATEPAEPPEPVTTPGWDVRSLVLGVLVFVVVIALGLAVLAFAVVRAQVATRDVEAEVRAALASAEVSPLLEQEVALAEAERSDAATPADRVALARLRLALWREWDGEPSRLDAVRALLATPPPAESHDLAMLRAEEAIAADHASDAAAALGRDRPENDDERLLFAEIAAAGGDAERASRHLEALDQPAAAWTAIRAARVLHAVGRAEDARARLDDLLRRTPTHIAARVTRLELAQETPEKQRYAAETLLAEAVGGGDALSPRLAGRLHAVRARAIAATGADPREAIDAGLAVDGTNPDLLYARAEADAGRGELVGALRALDTILRSRRGHHALGAAVLVELELDRVDAAEQRVAEASRSHIRAADLPALRALIAVAGRGDRPPEMPASTTPLALFAGALAAIETRAPDAAARVNAAATALEGASDPFERGLVPRTHGMRAWAAVATGDAAAAAEAVRAALDAAPHDPWVHLWIARARELRGDRAGAALHYDRAAVLGRQCARAHYERARFYTDAADGRSRATAAVQDYLTLAPSGPRAARAADMLAATPR